MTITNLSAYPLKWPDGWPRTPAHARRGGKFNKGERQYSTQPGSNHSWVHRKDLSISDATKRVLDELKRLGVVHGDSIISTNLVLRLDGYPRSDQRAPDDPGVAVYWQKIGDGPGPMKVMAIDQYQRVADNLAAIAATLEAMRAISRHGGGQIMERAFTGFTALPAPDWRPVLGFPSGAQVTKDEVQARFRALAMKHHPDNGDEPDAELFGRITEAKDRALKALSA